ATNEYQEESDLIGNYIEERCVLGTDLKAQASLILKDLQEWAKDNGFRYVKRNEFIDYMKKRGFRKDVLSAGEGKGNIFWFGIGLKGGETQDDFMERPY
ncbi:MAG TPA: hypothetical protein P5110_10110, partial [Candidatus Omnitrophota bacterium]|nr:hypothetical protein [Candidatus Omnitrophota bacterium]